MTESITREMWYRHPEVLYQIVNACRDRETAFLGKAEQKIPPVRNIFSNYTGFLKKNMEAFNFQRKNYNIYHSLATYKHIRLFSYAPKIRKEQSREWNKNYHKHLTSYDLGLDFDTPTGKWEDAHKEASMIKKDLDLYGVPYNLKWSGAKGFHIVIPYENLPEIKNLEEEKTSLQATSLICKRIAQMISTVYGKRIKSYKKHPEGGETAYLPSLDLGIYDYRRVWKAPYSWVCETGLIALPLTDEQFETFNKLMVKPERVLAEGIRNRGLLTRRGTKENLIRYLNEVLGFNYEK